MALPFIRNYKINQKLAKFVVPLGNCFFYAALLITPFLALFKSQTEIEEHGYLHGYAIDEMGADSMKFMDKTMELISESCSNEPKIVSKVFEVGESADGDKFSRWSQAPFPESPEVFKKIVDWIRLKIPSSEVVFNSFNYVFGKGDAARTVPGHSVLCRLRCPRCASRGSILLVVTIDTERCENDYSSAAVGISLLEHLSGVSNLLQDVLLLITQRQLPYAAGTRQFLDDYLDDPDFPLRSGNFHNAIAIDLGCNNCETYLANYESIDGYLPNQDIVNAFLKNGTTLGLKVAVNSLWGAVFRMSMNSYARNHHVPLLHRNVNSFSVICGRRAFNTTKPETLLRALTLTARNHNNLDTFLERSHAFYFFVDAGSHIAISRYAVLIPLFTFGVAMQLLFSPYCHKFTTFVSGVTIYMVNSIVGPIWSYIFLVRQVSGSKDFFDLSTEDKQVVQVVRKALVILIVSCVILLIMNVVTARFARSSSESTYPVNGPIYLKRDLRDELRRLSKLVVRYAGKNIGVEEDRGMMGVPSRFMKVFTSKRALEAQKNLPSPRKTHSVDESGKSKRTGRISQFLSRIKERRNAKLSNTPSVPEDKVEVPEPEVTEAESEERIKICEEKLEEMGPAWILRRFPDALPDINVVVTVGTLFFAVSYLMAMMVLNWPLTFVLTLFVTPLLRQLEILSPGKRSVLGSFIFLFYVIFLVLFVYNSPALIREIKANSTLLRLSKLVQARLADLSRKLNDYDSFKGVRFGFKIPAEWSIYKRIYALAEQRVLLDSKALPIIWFIGLPIIFHCILANILFLVERRSGPRET